MNLDSHIDELADRHRRLEEVIRLEIQRPVQDTARLQELKKQKLHLKDEIHRLRRSG